MLKRRVPWWMYLSAVIYVLTFCFNARQEFWSPANTGWVPSWPAARVAGVRPRGPMEKAGLQAGDILIAADRQPLTGMPGWFIARAHFGLHQPINLRIQRGGQPRSLKVVITEPAWRTWSTRQLSAVLAFYFVRLILLLLAIAVGFSRPERLRARLVALMLAVGAVAEGYPSSGWAAALHQLPAVLAIPICLATASCLLAPVLWLAFFTDFARPWLWQRWRWPLVLMPGAILGVPIIISAIAIIYSPEALARPWPQVLSAIPVRLIQDIAGVTPLLFFNALPAYRPGVQVLLLEVWLGWTILYLTAGALILAAAWIRIDHPCERRRLGALCLAVVVFALVVVHNVFERNWAGWFGTPLPTVLSTPVSVAVEFAFLLVPMTLVYYVLTDNERTVEASTRSPAI